MRTLLQPFLWVLYCNCLIFSILRNGEWKHFFCLLLYMCCSRYIVCVYNYIHVQACTYMYIHVYNTRVYIVHEWWLVCVCQLFIRCSPYSGLASTEETKDRDVSFEESSLRHTHILFQHSFQPLLLFKRTPQHKQRYSPPSNEQQC